MHFAFNSVRPRRRRSRRRSSAPRAASRPTATCTSPSPATPTSAAPRSTTWRSAIVAPTPSPTISLARRLRSAAQTVSFGKEKPLCGDARRSLLGSRTAAPSLMAQNTTRKTTQEGPPQVSNVRLVLGVVVTSLMRRPSRSHAEGEPPHGTASATTPKICRSWRRRRARLEHQALLVLRPQHRHLRVSLLRHRRQRAAQRRKRASRTAPRSPTSRTAAPTLLLTNDHVAEWPAVTPDAHTRRRRAAPAASASPRRLQDRRQRARRLRAATTCRSRAWSPTRSSTRRSCAPRRPCR